MRKRICAAVLSLLLMGCHLSAAAAPPTEEAESIDLLEGITADNYPRVDGSTATLPLSLAVYRLATGCSMKEADEAVVHSKTTNSYLKLINKEADLLIVADKNETVDAAAAQTGVELDIKPIALDAFVFMTNEENPVTSLSKEEIVGIYSGQITNWSQVGGEEKVIVPFQRNENAGSQTAMKSLVMQGTEMIPAELLEIGTMEGLLEAVASYNNEANALGYSYYYYSNLMYQTPGLRFMAVDGVLPCNETVQEGTYPYIAQYYAVVRSDEPEDTPARRIYDWLTTVSGQELAADLGYIPVDSQVEPEQVHYEEYAEEPLPIGEDERLAIMTGKKSFVILDRDGKITNRFENAELCDSGLMGYWQGAIVIQEDKPLPIKMKTGTGTGQYLAGLYSLKEDRWLIEPTYYELHMLSDTLCTDSDITLSQGRLITLDGTELYETGQYYSRAGDYIYDGSHIFDLDGNLLSQFDGSVRDIIGDELFLINLEDGSTVLQDVYGNRLWREGSGLYYSGQCGEYLNWTDENGAGIITDRQLTRVTDDVVLYQENPESGLAGNGLRLISQSPDGERKLIGLWDGVNSYYYVCDGSYHVTAQYPAEQVSLEMRGDEVIPRYWRYADQEGILYIEELWSGLVLEIPMTDMAANWVMVYRKGSVAIVQYMDETWQTHGNLFVDGELTGQTFDGSCILQEIEEQVLLAGVYDYETDTYSGWYYLEDGTCLSEDRFRTLYANSDFRCVQYGSYIYVEDYDGNLYARLLYSDEEREEPEMKMW